ncbi:MAG TPA: hypothetical protein VNT79_17325 [Phycisphaerae bacterium]|nr:hypothetical protein [Phycisphaerae bacterium]
MKSGEKYLILGGGGMIGRQIAHEISSSLSPASILIWSMSEAEVQRAVEPLSKQFSKVKFEGVWGDMFLRSEWTAAGGARQRRDLLDSAADRAKLLEDLLDDMNAADERSTLANVIRDFKPGVIVDAVNTATGISYQDVFTTSHAARKALGELLAESAADSGSFSLESFAQTLETLLLSQSIPQLIRHVLIIKNAMVDAGTRLYLKVGTTGTGGMGLNIPYTHSEDKPSTALMTKTAIAFAHTGLLFLMARTPGCPVVKELKPGALVGYANIERRKQIRDHKQGGIVQVYETRTERLGAALDLREAPDKYRELRPLEAVVIDTGENGIFTRGEFEAITHIWQMEFITPEEIAEQVVLEIKGSNTGYDVIAAIDSAVMNPTYRAGYLRQFALNDVARLEKQTGLPSVALGQLGPPELGKLLWEAFLLKTQYATLTAVLAKKPQSLSEELFTLVQRDAGLQQAMAAVGLPILTPAGDSLIRGPFIRIPEIPNVTKPALTPEAVNAWADKGWIDLRPANMQRWVDRIARMNASSRDTHGCGSAAFTRESYVGDEISIGAVVGWIFNIEGYRIK